MADLETLFPGKEIFIAGEKVTVEPLRFGQLATAAKMLAPVVKSIAPALRGADQEQALIDLAIDWVQVLADGGEDLLKFLAWSIKKEREWLDGLDLDDGMSLLKAVYEANVDFFSQRLLPLVPKPLQVQEPIGDTSSESSSQPVIDAPTSTNTQ